MRSRITWKHVDREAWIDMNHVKIFHTHRNDSFRIRIYIYVCVPLGLSRDFRRDIFPDTRRQADRQLRYIFIVYLFISCKLF